MPRGFLVKRAKKHHIGSPKTGTSSEDERVENGYDIPLQLCTHIYNHPYGSPDSGFSQSPVNLTIKDNINKAQPREHSPTNSCSSEDFSKSSQSPRNGFSLNTSNKDSLVNQNDRTQTKLEHLSFPLRYGNVQKNNNAPKTADFNRGMRSNLNFRLSPHAMSNPLSISTASYGSPFYYSAFDRLSVNSPKGQGFPRNAPFLPPPGLFPGFPPTMGIPPKAPSSAPSSPGDLLSPNKRKATDHVDSGSTPGKTKSTKKPKAARKIQFDEDKSSPVSGTIIRDPSDVDDDNGIRVVSGDIDSSLNYVEVTPEAREEIAKIDNKIGAYICQLCKENYDDAFQLAQHRCSRIIHVEYRCPECDKVFNCPANLASHRRWHKPRPNANNSSTNNNNNTHGHNENNKAKGTGPLKADAKRALDAINGNIANSHLHPALFVDNNVVRTEYMLNRGIENMMQRNNQRNSPSPEEHADNEGLFECEVCSKKFRRQAYLRKHMASHVEGDATLPCSMCSKVFRTDAAHTKHIIEAHNILPPKPKLLGGPQPMDTHMMPGSRGEFACALCGNNLPSKLELERHQRIQHPNEVYSCKYCTAVFYSSPGLTRHINKCHPSENRQVILLHMPQMPQINSPC